ncbi:hypothetical protein HPT27_05880 [Permianibacter sp. IMCC34836]|uniref:hypothetical protein n=1 Tax=Permianibacter fluminis TaxID=2738515 RepID=UPI001557CD0C|nr:hypothetical protein [Permianibacter fluminis]NQD36546.1 hypothetical protein [Permianibacter fluminis]
MIRFGVFLLSCFCLPLLAAPLRLAVVDVPPYGFLLPAAAPLSADQIATDAAIGGAYKDIGELLANASQSPMQFQLLPYPRAVDMVLHGESDLTIMFGNSALHETAREVAPLANVEVVLVGHGQKGAALRTDALNGLVIGRLRGGCDELSGRPDLHLFDLNDHKSGLRMLQAGRIQALCSVALALQVAAIELHLDWQKFGKPVVLGRRTVWLFASPQLPDTTLQVLRKAVKKLTIEGRIDAVLKRYAKVGLGQ